MLRAERGQASGPRDPKGRKSNTPILPLTNNSSRRQRRAATSSVELQPAAWGGGELRGSKSRKSSAHFWARQHPIHRPRFARFVLGAPPPHHLKRRCARGRRFLLESRYSLSAYSSSPLAANCATQRVAQELSLTHRPNSVGFGLRALGVGQRPSAQARRLCEPQKHDQQLSPTHSPLLGPARRENRIRFSRLKNKHSPKLAPVLRPVSASLRLRFRSATFSRALGNLVKTRKRVSTISLLRRSARLFLVARWDFISILLTAKRVKSPFRRSGDGVFAHGRVFRAPARFTYYSAIAEIAESLL